MHCAVRVTFCFLALMLAGTAIKASTNDLHIESVTAFGKWDIPDSSDVYLVAKVHFGSNCNFNGFTVTPGPNQLVVKACYQVGNNLTVCFQNDTMFLGRYAAGAYNIQVLFNQTSGVTCSWANSADTVSIDFSNVNTAIVLVLNPAEPSIQYTGNHLLRCTVPGGQPVQIQILSMEGKLQEEKECLAEPVFFDVANYPAGIYLVIFKGNGWQRVKKFYK